MNNSWIYIDRIGNAGLPSRPPRFKDLGEHSIEIFTRELIQNSLDARFKDNIPVTIKINIEDWDDEDIQGFFGLIGKDYLEKFSESYNYAITDVKPKMTDGYKIIKGTKKNTFALTVEENNCIGLTGSVKGIDRKSNFNSLIRKVDDNEAKKELSNSGGTWGKGSSVFVYSSELWMWFCYTLLSEPNNADDGNFQHKRFIGRSILSPYYSADKDISYWGDAWFCKPATDSFPYINAEADSYAELFGLEKRMTEPGCTFFIPFFNTFLENPTLERVTKEFHDQILKNWYIPIYNEDLVIILTNKKGQTFKLNKSYLTGVDQLKFKLEILQWRDKDCPPDERFIKETYEIDVPALKRDYINKNNSFASERQKVKVDLLIRKINEEEDFNNEWATCNRVALTRNRGMLIADHEPFELNSIKTESILFGGLLSKSETSDNKRKHLDLFLAYSENPAHNKWCIKSQDYNSCFLDFFEGRRPAPEYYVNRIFDEIYKSFKKLFDQEMTPEVSKDICSLFKKIARLKLSGETSGGPSLFSLRTPSDTTNPSIDEFGRFVFKYLVKSSCNDKSIAIEFKSVLNSLEGENSSDFNVLGIPEFKTVELLEDDNEIIASGDCPILLLNPSDEKLIKIRTCRISGNRIFKNLDPLIKASARKINNNNE